MMKKNHIVYSLLLCGTLLMMGCSDPKTPAQAPAPAGTPAPAAHSETKPDTKAETQTKKEPSDQAELQTKKPASQQTEIDLAFVKQNLKKGMTKEEVKGKFGDKYSEVKNAMDDSDMLRYDLGVKDGYSFNPPDKLDDVDMGGLSQGSMKAQLFVGLSKEGKVTSYTFYSKAKNGEVQEYRLMEDGTVKEPK